MFVWSHTNRRWFHEVARATADARNHFSSKTRIKILYLFQLLFATCCKFNLNELSIERKLCIYYWFPCTNFIKIMPNLNTAKLQTHVSFCENFVSTYKIPRNGTCHWAARISLRIKKIHETARAPVSRCAVKDMFSHEIFFTNRHNKLSNARKPSAARACVSLRGLFCFNFEAPCRFRILIISLIRENWALNSGKMKDPG